MVVKKLPKRFFLFSFAFIFCMLFVTMSATAGVDKHITRTESGFYYTIQKGDTLWDLSNSFSNSSWAWPEMWQYNPQITNPHLIYPGQKILIYKKEWEGKEKQPEAVVEEPVQKIKPLHTFKEIDRVGFIRETAIGHHGTIFKVQGDAILINTGDQVYIYPEPGAPPLSVGSKYTTFRTLDPVKDPETKEYIGIQHLLSGIVEITAIEPEFAIGKIVFTYRDILINDLLMPYAKRSVNIPIKKSKQGLAGKVIKSEEEDTIIAQFSIIFIDKGEVDGVEPGQFYSLYLQESARPNPAEIKNVLLTPYLIGEIIILHTEKTTAAALITNSKQQIIPGNLVLPLAVSGN
ncbi:MAG: LysM peptidoglycan-binding domain-containing protein [Desulfobacteraceae bacterium]|jgi:LysM repeat protein|nr:LysM peptidoglycan-binding domain-containing protein [Desulfobacteraceae bacterium]